MTDIIAETDKLLKELKQENEQLKKDSTILILVNQDYRKENEQLKQQINGLNEEKDQLIQCYNNNLNEMDAVADDNRQLQKENERLKRKIQRERTSFTKTHERWGKEAENKIKELSEENEQLQETIKFIFKQIKAFREDCRTYQDFDGASTITELIRILKMVIK